MFFGSQSRPGILPADVKVRQEVKRVCTPGKRCQGSMPALSVINLFIAGYLKDISGIRIERDGLDKEVFLYWDGSVDYGVEYHKCVAIHKDNTYSWYEEKL